MLGGKVQSKNEKKKKGEMEKGFRVIITAVFGVVIIPSLSETLSSTRFYLFVCFAVR